MYDCIIESVYTLVLLRRVVIVDLLADALALPQIACQILLLLLVMMPQEFLPVVGIHVLLLFNDLPLHLLLQQVTRRVNKRPALGSCVMKLSNAHN